MVNQSIDQVTVPNKESTGEEKSEDESRERTDKIALNCATTKEVIQETTVVVTERLVLVSKSKEAV